MRLNAQLASFLLSSIVLVGSAHAADEEPVVEDKAASNIERPNFVVRDRFFFELIYCFLRIQLMLT